MEDAATGRPEYLIVCDLDGTLLDDDKRISELDRKAIETWIKKGQAFAFCTGRIAGMSEAYADLCDDGQGRAIPAICSNGGWIGYLPGTKEPSPLVTGTFPQVHHMEKEEVIQITTWLDQNDINYGILTDRTVYFKEDGPFLGNFKKYNEDEKSSTSVGMEQISGSEAIDSINEPISKLLVQLKGMATVLAINNNLAEMGNPSFAVSRNNVGDFNPKAINKGKGLEIIAEALNIPLYAVYAFGDQENDLPMFEVAGCSIATANAPKNVKEHAARITESNKLSGVGQYIEEILFELGMKD